MARFSAVPIGNRYEELKEKRVLERQEAIRKGAIPDPDKPRRLEDAITFVGTCQDMCPEFERHEREYQQSIESFEKVSYILFLLVQGFYENVPRPLTFFFLRHDL